MGSIHIVSGEHVTSQMIAEALQLDIISYDECYHLTLETCIAYFEKNNDIYIMALDDSTGAVIGYINYSPINERTFSELASGSLIDTLLTGNELVEYSNEGQYYGYFSSIVVHPDYRKQGVATQMLLYWENLVCHLAYDRRIFFKGIIADAVSVVGAHLLSNLGFSFVKPSEHDSMIMILNPFAEDAAHTKLNDKILTAYRKYKNERGELRGF